MIFRRTLDWWLAVLGAALLLLYMPNGLFHIYLGPRIYARDLALLGHLGLSLFFLHRSGHLRALRKPLVAIGILAFIFSILLLDRRSMVDGLKAVKWFLLWTDTLCTGYLIFLQRRFLRSVGLVIAAALAIITVDAAIGLYEVRYNTFVFAVDKSEETQAGTQVARSQQMEGLVRVQGLQRDVFGFANFMAVGCTACVALFLTQWRWWLRAGAVVGALVFLRMLLLSGGRSALFGVGLAVLLAGLAMLSPPLLLRHARKLLFAAVFVGVVACVFGLGPVLHFALSFFETDSRTFNLASTWDRDAIWAERIGSMAEYPLSFFTGLPFSMWAIKRRPEVLFADNQLLWFFYHAGVVGLVTMLVFLYRQARPQTLLQYPRAYLLLVLSMALVLGEAVARESMLMFGALPMFILFGFFAGADAFPDKGWEQEDEDDEEDEDEEDEEEDEEEEHEGERLPS